MINVIGMGYIGLPTALILAASGNEVIGTDINNGIIKKLQQGQLTFIEQGLEELFQKASEGGIQFETEYVCADIYIVAVPTPYNKDNKKVEMKYVVNAVERILAVAPNDCIVVIESTISPGCIDNYIRPLLKNCSKKIRLGHAPERIIPGAMIEELKNNSRTIGTDDKESGKELKKLYSSFCSGEIVLTDIRSAEMSKVVENTYRDINIAFANELAKICRSAGTDVYEIIRIANKHPRVNILTPGPGVGGHCISVDPWFLVGDYPGLANITLAARKINDSMPEFVLERIYEIMQENEVEDISKVGLYGLTYKENVDDTRESPTLQLLHCMKKHLAPTILSYDPYVKEKIVDNQVFSLDSFLEKVEIVVIMVAHSEIIDKADKIKNKIVLDTRNCINAVTYKL